MIAVTVVPTTESGAPRPARAVPSAEVSSPTRPPAVPATPATSGTARAVAPVSVAPTVAMFDAVAASWLTAASGIAPLTAEETEVSSGPATPSGEDRPPTRDPTADWTGASIVTAPSGPVAEVSAEPRVVSEDSGSAANRDPGMPGVAARNGGSPGLPNAASSSSVRVAGPASTDARAAPSPAVPVTRPSTPSSASSGTADAVMSLMKIPIHTPTRGTVPAASRIDCPRLSGIPRHDGEGRLREATDQSLHGTN